MDLFDIVKKVFKDDKEWEEVLNIDKSRNFFMVNRIMSIQFPIQASQFNKLKVNPYPVVDWWHRTLSKHYTRQPGWIFTKTKKRQDSKREDKDKSDSSVERFICEKYEISRKDLNQLRDFFPDKYGEWINSISEQISTSIK